MPHDPNVHSASKRRILQENRVKLWENWKVKISFGFAANLEMVSSLFFCELFSSGGGGGEGGKDC